MPEKQQIFKSEIVDIPQIREILNTSNSSVHRFRSTGVLPEPDFYVGNSPRWFGKTLNDHLLNSKQSKAA